MKDIKRLLFFPMLCLCVILIFPLFMFKCVKHGFDKGSEWMDKRLNFYLIGRNDLTTTCYLINFAR